MLSRDPEGIGPDHQVPADRGVPRSARTAISDRQPPQCLSPADRIVPRKGHRASVSRDEQEVVIDEAAGSKALDHRQLASQDL